MLCSLLYNDRSQKTLERNQREYTLNESYMSSKFKIFLIYLNCTIWISSKFTIKFVF